MAECESVKITALGMFSSRIMSTVSLIAYSSAEKTEKKCGKEYLSKTEVDVTTAQPTPRDDLEPSV